MFRNKITQYGWFAKIDLRNAFYHLKKFDRKTATSPHFPASMEYAKTQKLSDKHYSLSIHVAGKKGGYRASILVKQKQKQK